jgi:hypothetical protein
MTVNNPGDIYNWFRKGACGVRWFVVLVCVCEGCEYLPQSDGVSDALQKCVY